MLNTMAEMQIVDALDENWLEKAESECKRRRT